MNKVLIMLFECNSTSKSDYKYVRYLLTTSYIDNNRHLEKIYAGSKCELYSESTKHKIINIIKKYDEESEFTIVWFADVDTGEKEDRKRNAKIVELSRELSEFYITKIVWFNYDIEDVCIGERVEKRRKTKCADDFLRKSAKYKIDEPRFKNKNALTTIHTSNIFCVFDEIFDRR